MVTGASGFIGRAVCAELMRRGVDVLAVSRQPAVNIPGARMVFTRDYCDLERSPADVCIHLAGGNVVPDGPNGEQVFSDETAALTRSVLKKDFRRIVYASTALVYEDSDALPKCEADITRPRSAYGRGKLAVESAFLGEGHVVARIANVYGHGMATFNVLSHILSQIKGEGEIRLRNGTPVRDFIHVDDVGRALVELAIGEHQGIFNVGTGIGTSITALVELVKAIAGQSRRTVVFEAMNSRPSYLVLNPARMAVVFGWKPQITLANGIRTILAT